MQLFGQGAPDPGNVRSLSPDYNTHLGVRVRPLGEGARQLVPACKKCVAARALFNYEAIICAGGNGREDCRSAGWTFPGDWWCGGQGQRELLLCRPRRCSQVRSWSAR
eukprot:354423-Chlamydomonas_euryale.AAC.14